MKALAVAGELIRQTTRAETVHGLVERLILHLDAIYVNNPLPPELAAARDPSYAAAAKGAESLLAGPLPRAARLRVFRAVAFYKAGFAMQQLERQAKAGQLPVASEPGALPKVLAEVMAASITIHQEYPGESDWGRLAAIAGQVRQYASQVAWPDKVKALRGPDAWAIEIALTVVRADADPAAVKAAIDVVQGVVKEYSAVEQPGARQLAAAASRTLAAAPLLRSPAARAGVLTSHAAVLDAYAKYLFQENLKGGNGELNAKLSDVQKEFVETLAKLVAGDAGQAAAAWKAAQEHVKPWIEQNHWAVAEEVYQALAKAMPAAERWPVELAVVDLWIQQALQQHNRLAAAGLTVPRELDPALNKALVRCYELQAGLEPASPKLAQVRGLSDKIVAHYKAIEYEDVAETAIKTRPAIAAKPEKPERPERPEKPEAAVEAAEEYAAFQLIQLQEERARRELKAMLKQHGAEEKIALSPAFQAVIGRLDEVHRRPAAKPARRGAAEQIFGIAGLFEQHGAHAVAAGVYADFAKFASGVKTLSQSSPNAASVAQHAALAAATALDAQARKVLAKAMADRKADEAPPAKLSDEFVAAIAAYQGLLEAYPESVLSRETLGRIMVVAMEYAKLDAWDAADSVYADLLKSKLKIRRPERLRFARGLCQLGRAMPDHAREVLAALGAAGTRGGGETALAVSENDGSRRRWVRRVWQPRRRTRSAGRGPGWHADAGNTPWGESPAEHRRAEHARDHRTGSEHGRTGWRDHRFGRSGRGQARRPVAGHHSPPGGEPFGPGRAAPADRSQPGRRPARAAA